VYSNHLQSASLELDDKAAVISYEEYHPYGTTSYQSRNTSINAVAKRYRFTGKERDEESGLNYHGARYYMPWLGRWCAVDPLEAKYAGLNGYAYCANNPLLYIDIDGKDIIVFTTVLVQIPTVNIDQKTGQQTQAYNTITQCYTTAIIAEGPNEYFERTIIAYVDNTMKVLPLESEKQDVTKKVSAYDHVKAGKLITQFGLPSWYTDRSFISTPNSSASRAAENELSGLKQTQRDVEFYQQDKESKETQLLVVKSAGTLLLSELALGIFGLSAMFGNTAEYIEYLVSRGAIESSTFSAVRASSIIVEDLAANGTNLISFASNCEEVANCVNYASFVEEAATKTSSNLWKVGSYSELRGLEVGLDAHHVGQKALMSKFVPGYSASTAPSILVPKLGHTVGSGVVSRSTVGLTNARQVLARDIFELRRVYGGQGIQNSSLQQLIQMNKSMYPGAFIK
jgi:RHS repeat-associated protein